jgi:hypothetical protein
MAFARQNCRRFRPGDSHVRSRTRRTGLLRSPIFALNQCNEAFDISRLTGCPALTAHAGAMQNGIALQIHRLALQAILCERHSARLLLRRRDFEHGLLPQPDRPHSTDRRCCHQHGRLRHFPLERRGRRHCSLCHRRRRIRDFKRHNGYHWWNSSDSDIGFSHEDQRSYSSQRCTVDPAS